MSEQAPPLVHRIGHSGGRHVLERVAVQQPSSGKASFIAYSGGKTASGALYRPQAFTAAHRTLPFGTRLRVTDLKTRRHVQVTVTDRGPFVRGRVLDLSRGAAQALGMESRGVIQVRTEVLSENGGRTLAKGS